MLLRLKVREQVMTIHIPAMPKMMPIAKESGCDDKIGSGDKKFSTMPITIPSNAAIGGMNFTPALSIFVRSSGTQPYDTCVSPVQSH